MEIVGSCPQWGRCGGCSVHPEGERGEHREKLRVLRELGDPWGIEGPELVQGERWSYRDRVDLTLTSEDGQPRLGLWDQDFKEILDLPFCPILSPALHKWLMEFRQIPLPKVRKGSVRLRVGPKGNRGVWIDFSNLDIKQLLQEGSWLSKLAQCSIVEFGQKRKRLVERSGGWGLGDPVPEPWFSTWENDVEVPLSLHVGGFSQPSMKLNRLLVRTVLRALRETGLRKWVELGAGSGNLTLPLAQNAEEVLAVESDPLASEALAWNLRARSLESRVTIQQSDFQRLEPQVGDSAGLLVDPPRSGLGPKTLDWLAQSGFPTMVYVSCHTQSFQEDAQGLRRLGFALKSLTGVDQFPWSKHLEIVSLFQKT